MKLFHYCCEHSIPGIRRDGALKPNPHPLLGGMRLVWLTDLDVPDRAALGLTSMIIKCDRTEYRVTVDAPPTRWVHFARRLTRFERESLESADGVLPMHWFVSESPIPVLSIDSLRGAS